jgi:hypothetical protein
MAVITLEVPSKAQMGYGIGKAIQYGVEYEVINDKQIELTSADEMRLAKMVVAFNANVLEFNNRKFVQVEHPKHEA